VRSVVGLWSNPARRRSSIDVLSPQRGGSRARVGRNQTPNLGDKSTQETGTIDGEHMPSITGY